MPAGSASGPACGAKSRRAGRLPAAAAAQQAVHRQCQAAAGKRGAQRRAPTSWGQRTGCGRWPRTRWPRAGAGRPPRAPAHSQGSSRVAWAWGSRPGASCCEGGARSAPLKAHHSAFAEQGNEQPRHPTRALPPAASTWAAHRCRFGRRARGTHLRGASRRRQRAWAATSAGRPPPSARPQAFLCEADAAPPSARASPPAARRGRRTP
mmetsp:Transcript_19014/g.55191  ORF Transcript_19014/g.55191 Transcript_19014/m.55191 type:complete len:208 (+) Transcript_19014:2262-2885(+)